MLEPAVQLRPYPWPYRALLAVCSDLDETPDARVYWETLRFLNTTADTTMGPGVGLEVGNTLYFDMPSGQFSYWNTDDAGRDMVHDLIRSGHIDCLHSFGDAAGTRAQAARALEALQRHGCGLEVWVDHAVAPTNLGPDIMQGHGDEPGHAAYHADLTFDFGMRFVWRGRVTSVLGQDRAADLGGLWTPRHPLASLRSAVKETVKQAAARCGSVKYAMHGPNRALRRSTLRDGREVLEFLRCNPHWGGVSCGDTAAGMAEVLTPVMLRRLAERQGVCVLYTHLGKIVDPDHPLPKPTVRAFRRLAEARDSGVVGVLSTRRLLRYLAAREALTLSTQRGDHGLQVDVQLHDPQHISAAAPVAELLAGLTFYVPHGVPCAARVNGEALTLQHNPPDHTGRASVSVPLPTLQFPGASGRGRSVRESPAAVGAAS